MICLDLILPDRANQFFKYSGIDSPGNCLDKNHFKQYPYSITYNYNSRGFRDQEWPESVDDLKNSIWCIGDSFTVGIGSPLEHTWPARISIASQRRTINVSMDGASNEWIARTTKKIVDTVNPANIVIMWSFTHRREHPDTTSFDNERIQHYVQSSVEEDWDNFLNCRRCIKQLNSNITEFAIPNFHKPEFILKTWNDLRGVDWPITPPHRLDELYQLPHNIQSELVDLQCFDNLQDIFKFQQQLLNDQLVIPIIQQDYARDGFHFDLITADWVADCVQTHLSQVDSSRNLTPALR